jgi:hypothetical protein
MSINNIYLFFFLKKKKPCILQVLAFELNSFKKKIFLKLVNFPLSASPEIFSMYNKDWQSVTPHTIVQMKQYILERKKKIEKELDCH